MPGALDPTRPNKVSNKAPNNGIVSLFQLFHQSIRVPIKASNRVREEPYIRSAYARVTPRTFQRELARLADLGFLKFESGDEPTLEVDFNAISRH